MNRHAEGARCRRELVLGTFRYVALGLLTAGGAVLVTKRRQRVREGRCVDSGLCDRCKVLEQCGLPQAVSARKALIGINHGKK